jgi:hypothetical protein
MKKEELKQIIKPLIKECLKEVLIEEGFAKVLSESAIISTQVPTKNNIQPVKQKNNLEEITVKQNNALREMQENRKKTLDSIGMSGFDAFAGTQPLKEDTEIVNSNPGIDISKLLENKQVWKQTLNAMNGKKVKE